MPAICTVSGRVTLKVVVTVEETLSDVVKLAVSFAQLPDGTSYPQQTLLDATGKKIEVKVTNSDYKKLGR